MASHRGLDKFQTAFRLGVSPRTVEDPRWRLRVGLRAYRIGRALRFREEDILRLIDHGLERVQAEEGR